MPHFIIETNKDLLTQIKPKVLMQLVHDTADQSGLFKESVIKVRIIPYKYSLVAGKKAPFIHILGHIMAGRSIEQKAELSAELVKSLGRHLPEIQTIAVDIRDIDRLTYNNLASVAD